MRLSSALLIAAALSITAACSAFSTGSADREEDDPVQQVSGYFPGYERGDDIDRLEELEADLVASGATSRRICGDVSNSEPAEFIEGWRNGVAVQVFRPLADAYDSLTGDTPFPAVPAAAVDVWKIGPSSYRGALPWAQIERDAMPTQPEPGVQESDDAFRDRLWQDWVLPMRRIEQAVLDDLAPLVNAVPRTDGTDVMACVDRQLQLARDAGETPAVEIITDGLDVNPLFTPDLSDAHIFLALHCDPDDPEPEKCPNTRADWEQTLSDLGAVDPRVIDAIELDQMTDQERQEIVAPRFTTLTRHRFDELMGAER